MKADRRAARRMGRNAALLVPAEGERGREEKSLARSVSSRD